jgi:hypothetical protein
LVVAEGGAENDGTLWGETVLSSDLPGLSEVEAEFWGEMEGEDPSSDWTGWYISWNFSLDFGAGGKRFFEGVAYED